MRTLAAQQLRCSCHDRWCRPTASTGEGPEGGAGVARSACDVCHQFDSNTSIKKPLRRTPVTVLPHMLLYTS